MKGSDRTRPLATRTRIRTRVDASIAGRTSRYDPRVHEDPPVDAPPHGCTWCRYVALLIDAHGSAAALADRLIRRADEAVGLPEDPQSIERGIRRLATRGNAPGGQYGRWLLRFFGVPPALVETARWMGQYHGRFADLPAPVYLKGFLKQIAGMLNLSPDQLVADYMGAYSAWEIESARNKRWG